MSHSTRILHFADEALIAVSVNGPHITVSLKESSNSTTQIITVAPSDVQELIKILREAIK